MQGQRVDAGQVAVVVSDDLVCLEVPALDLLVLAGAEEVGVPVGRDDAAHGGDVAGERQLECSRSQIPVWYDWMRWGGTTSLPDFDDAIASAGGKPLVAGVDRD